LKIKKKVGHKGFKFNGCGLINHPALTGTPPAEGNSEPLIGLLNYWALQIPLQRRGIASHLLDFKIIGLYKFPSSGGVAGAA
jgi:hypothetical protein